MSLAVSILPAAVWVFLHLGHVQCFLPVGHRGPGEGGNLGGEDGKAVTCISNEFSCVTSPKCIPGRWTCDGDDDCEDGSDERPAHCGVRVCGPTEFSCVNEVGKCIPISWACDNHEDCADGSDEKNCTEVEKCPFGRFSCANGMCTQNAWKCDGHDDCGDGSDEVGCDPVTCSEDQIVCSSGSCLSKSWTCDGDADCPDGDDEKNCVGAPSPNITNVCTESEFVCRDRHYCIHQAWTCDGDKDCPDGTDEDEEMCGRKSKCADNEFTCSNGQCIQGHLQCSGRADCEDHSDEEDCGTSEPTCDSETQFDCGDGKMCIDIEKVCDNKNDCGNWQDEPRDNCGINECLTDNGGCDQVCVDTKDSYYCSCHAGYKKDHHNTCQDVDECATPGVCSQLCINRLGEYKCDCVEGYEKEPSDHSKCKATQGRPSLIFAQKKDVRMISLDRKMMTPVINSTRSACAVDYHFKTGKIFWSDVMEEKIYSANLDSVSGHDMVLADGVVTPDGLAVDWVYSHLYWTDTGTNTISVTDFRGLSSVVLIKDQMEEPRAIALHPAKGWMFWSDWGNVPKIERAGMDGSHREVILMETVLWPNGLTLDLVLDKLYWVDAKLNTIGSANLDGSQARIILFSPAYLKHPFSISVFEDLMYWSEWDSHTIYQANKFNGTNITAVTSSPLTGTPMVVQVYHPYIQPQYPNHCLPYNGHCTHWCLPSPQVSPHSPRTTCTCPGTLVLGKDGRSCNKKELLHTNTTESIEEIAHTVEAAVDSEAEAVPIVVSNDVEIVCIVIGGILAAAVLTSLVLYMFYRNKQTSKLVTVKFNNPTFKLTTPPPDTPVCIERQTQAASYVDLRPTQDMMS